VWMLEGNESFYDCCCVKRTVFVELLGEEV
jgi:hypothetical protein